MIRDQCLVRELVSSADRRSITGTRCERINGSHETIAADLVVDASGRGALMLAALDALGRARPPETTVAVDIGYASASFEIPEPRPDWQAVFTFPCAPSDSRCGYLLPVEGNRWMVSITELHCPSPPRDFAEFLDAARGCALAPSTTRSGMRGRRACHSGSALPQARGGITKP